MRIILIVLLICLTPLIAWAQEDCSDGNRLAQYTSQCRIANALERIALALEKRV